MEISKMAMGFVSSGDLRWFGIYLYVYEAVGYALISIAAIAISNIVIKIIN